MPPTLAKQHCMCQGDYRIEYRIGGYPWCTHCGMSVDHIFTCSRVAIYTKSAFFTDICSPTEFSQKAKDAVLTYLNTEPRPIALGRNQTRWYSHDDVYVVTWTKSITTWKVLIATRQPDGLYFEVIYNGGNERIYVDAFMNKRIHTAICRLESQ